MSYMVDKPPSQDPLMLAGSRKFEPKAAMPNYTMSRAAFKTYST